MKLAALGDSAVIVTLGRLWMLRRWAQVRSGRRVGGKPLPGLIECAQANATVTVFYDPARVPEAGWNVTL